MPIDELGAELAGGGVVAQQPGGCTDGPSEAGPQHRGCHLLGCADAGDPAGAGLVEAAAGEDGGPKGTAKTLEGVQHPDRDTQFTYINEQVKAHQDAGEPVISVDAKKKEQLGRLPAAGREWRPKGDPVQVGDHSFFTAGADLPLAVPTASTTSPLTPAG